MRGCGLVDLTTAAKLRPPTLSVPRCIKMAADALYNGCTPDELSEDANVQVGTAWSYMTRAATLLRPSDLLRVVPELVERDLWELLNDMEESVIGGKLTRLMEVVKRRLSSRGRFMRSEFQWEQLRIARSAIAKARLSHRSGASP